MLGSRKAGQTAPKIVDPHKGVIERARQFRKAPKPKSPASAPKVPNRPDALDARGRPEFVEVPPDPRALEIHRKLLDTAQKAGADVKSWSFRQFRYGEVRAILTRQWGRLHLSVSHLKRLPTWDEVAEIWYNHVAKNGEVGALLLPKPENYVNINKFVLQVQEIPQSLADEYD
jgi:hypothetical protein